MIPYSILNSEIQSFINKNIDVNISKLALQKNPFPEVDWITILNQIESKKKSAYKLPNWFSTKNIIYPSKISIEQTSSEITAKYKSNIVSGDNLIDLTGGFGVDGYYFSKKIKNVVHCEINPELSQIVKHNFEKLKTHNITCYDGDSIETLIKIGIKWDWIYIDPSRRNVTKGKVFMLKDCLPNIPENIDVFFKYSKAILIKTAPLLDISAGLSELKHVKKIHIVAIDNEVKELLWELNSDYYGKITISAINLTKEKESIFNFEMDNNINSVLYSLPQKYLYEPNSAIMKSGGFNEVSTYYNLFKLQKNSHLYTNSNLIIFPGRIFEIETTFIYHKNEMKKLLEGKQINISGRGGVDIITQSSSTSTSTSIQGCSSLLEASVVSIRSSVGR